MTEPIEKVAERVLELHRECQKRHRSPEMGRWIDTRNREYLDHAPALAREVLALRKLCEVMRDGVEHFKDYCESGGNPHGLGDETCSCSGCHALSEYRKHFPAPAVKPEGPKG